MNECMSAFLGPPAPRSRSRPKARLSCKALRYMPIISQSSVLRSRIHRVIRRMDGEYIVEGTNCDFEGNYIHYATRGGIRVFARLGKESGTSNCTVKNNRLYRNATAGIEVYGRNNLVEGNEIWGTIQHHPKSTEVVGADADGMRFFGSGHIIHGNYIHDISYRDPENIDPHIDCFQTWVGATTKLVMMLYSKATSVWS